MQLLKNMGFKTAAMALRDDSVGIDNQTLQAEEKLAIVLGTEGDGLSSQTIEMCIRDRIQCVLSGRQQEKELEKELQVLKVQHQGSLLMITARGTRSEIIEKIQAKNPLFMEVLPLTLEEIFISETEAVSYTHLKRQLRVWKMVTILIAPRRFFPRDSGSCYPLPGQQWQSPNCFFWMRSLQTWMRRQRKLFWLH